MSRRKCHAFKEEYALRNANRCRLQSAFTTGKDALLLWVGLWRRVGSPPEKGCQMNPATSKSITTSAANHWMTSLPWCLDLRSLNSGTAASGSLFIGCKGISHPLLACQAR